MIYSYYDAVRFHSIQHNGDLFHKTSQPNKPGVISVSLTHCQMIWFHKANLTKINLSHRGYLCWETNLV